MGNQVVLKYAYRTHLGKVRTDNQDVLLVDQALRLFIICDGAGGHEGGKLAAELAANKTVEGIKAALQGLKPGLSKNARLDAYEDIVREAMRRASKAVWEEAARRGYRDGAYSTLDLSWFVDESTMIIGHIGDGSIVRRHEESIAALTEDHNLGTELNDLKEESEVRATRAQIRGNGDLKTVTRAMGLVSSKPDVSRRPLSEWEYFLMCSDGLLDAMSPEEVFKIMAQAADLEAAATAILNGTLAGPARDNISFLLIGCQPALPAEERTKVFTPGHLADTFGALKLFEGLQQQELEAFIGRGQRVTKKDGEILMKQGEPARSLWVILDGTVEAYRDNVKVNTHAAPTVIGEGAFSKQARTRTATIHAVGPVRAIMIDRDDFMRFARDYKSAALLIAMSTNVILLDKTETLARKVSELKSIIGKIDQALDEAERV